MPCSKIFSGDLPELTYEIIKHFQNDFSTLYSCILVNRLWCRLAIPLLWENPFSISTKNYHFIDIYLHNLNGDLKTKLNKYKINDDPLPLNTLFNYPRFLKYLSIYHIVFSVEQWSKVADLTRNPGSSRYYLKDLSLPSVNEFKRLINMSLFNIFIENVVNLHTLEIETSSTYYNIYFDDIIELILQNTNLIKNLNFYSNSDYNEHLVIKDRTLRLINLHQNLKKIMVSYNNFPLYQSLLLSKDYNCSNTLNTIIFYYVDFKSINNLDKIFEQLNVLESIHIIYCFSLYNNFIQQIINLTKPFKLKSLVISEISQIESLKLLFQKSGDHLENFGYEFNYNCSPSLKQQLLELLIKYCKNIKLFDFNGVERQITYLIFNLIENTKHNLNYLSIKLISGSYETHKNIELTSSIILQNLGQIFPPILEYLSLSLVIKASDFEVFLKNSQDTFIKKLLIMNIVESQDSILLFIKEYIMKKKRVEYLAFISNPSYINLVVNLGCDKDLFSLKDEVKEFSLYNIKVKSYYSLNEMIDMYSL